MVVLLLPQKSFADITERKCKMNVTEIKPIEAVSAHKIRLAIYCRVSSDSEDQLHSFANQIRYYSTYTREHPEYELVDIYADEGITGTSMERRDEMNRMLNDCKGGRIDRILTKSVSRFARNTEELLLSVRMLKEIGVSVYFEEQSIDTAKLSAEMILTMPGVVAQQESISISENMRWSYRKRMECGEFNCCKAAYGFRMTDGLLEIFEPEAKVVRWMFRLALRGIGRQSIANLLTAKNIPTPSGGKTWSYTTVDQILRNPRYMGDAILQERYTTQTLPFRRKKTMEKCRNTMWRTQIRRSLPERCSRRCRSCWIKDAEAAMHSETATLSLASYTARTAAIPFADRPQTEKLTGCARQGPQGKQTAARFAFPKSGWKRPLRCCCTNCRPAEKTSLSR